MSAVTVTATKVRPLKGCLTRMVDAGEAMDVGDLVRIDSDGDVNQCDASTLAGTKGVLGIVVAGHKRADDGSIASGERVTVVLHGPVAGFSSLAEQTLHYVSETQGKIDNAKPTFARAVGYPISTTVFYFNPDPGDPGS